jgi:hypothetical protein
MDELARKIADSGLEFTTVPMEPDESEGFRVIDGEQSVVESVILERGVFGDGCSVGST